MKRVIILGLIIVLLCGCVNVVSYEDDDISNEVLMSKTIECGNACDRMYYQLHD